jgi:short-subunit dehydrogenase involved in D-alanine esterification of teichoic acids
MGASVFTCCRTQNDLVCTIRELQGKGLHVQGCVADVSDSRSRQAVVEQVNIAFQGMGAITWPAIALMCPVRD